MAAGQQQWLQRRALGKGLLEKLELTMRGIACRVTADSVGDGGEAPSKGVTSTRATRAGASSRPAQTANKMVKTFFVVT